MGIKLVHTKGNSILKRRVLSFLFILGVFMLMKNVYSIYEVYLLFYLKVIKGIWAFLKTLTFGKLHFIILIIVLIKFLMLFRNYTLKSFLVRLSSGALLIINLFFILWGFNYAQPTLEYAEGLSPIQLSELNKLAGQELNSLREHVTDQAFLRGKHMKDSDADTLFIELKNQTDSLISDLSFYTVPMPVFKDGALRILGIGGIYFPFSGEALYDDSSPLLRKTFIYAHEYFHAHSVTGEDECNFLAWKTLENSSNPNWKYAAYFDLFFTTAGQLGLTTEEKKSLVSPKVWSDVEFLRQERKSYQSFFHAISASTNDAYLKMLSSKEGTDAYDGYVKWAYRDLLSTPH